MDWGLRNKKVSKLKFSEEVDPMEGVTNMADVMLVFACGLMLALAVYWNIDLGPIGDRVDLEQGQEVTDSLELRDDLIETLGQGERYEKMGTVQGSPNRETIYVDRLNVNKTNL